MSRRLRALLVLVSVLAIAVSNISTVAAATQGYCGTNDTTKVRLWENAKGDTTDGNDSLWVCADVSHLGNISHLPAGNCHSPGFGSGSWNDCVNSYTVWVPSVHLWCFYGAINYSEYIDHRGAYNGQRFNLVYGDVLSSLRVQAHECTED